MYNILIAVALAAASFVGVDLSIGWVGAVLPALFVGIVAYVLLSRRTGQRVQRELDAILPLLQSQKVDDAKELLLGVKTRWGKWQLLLDGTIDAQIGMILYLQQKWDEALPLLVRGQWRNWAALTSIACIQWRKGDKDQAFDHLRKAADAAPKESMIYVIWATLLARSDRRDEALVALAKGLEQNKESDLLKDLQTAIANKRKIDTTTFPQTWYQFFPEDLAMQVGMRGRREGGPQEVLAAMQKKMGGQAPTPIKPNRAQRRGQNPGPKFSGPPR